MTKEKVFVFYSKAKDNIVIDKNRNIMFGKIRLKPEYFKFRRVLITVTKSMRIISIK